MFRLAISSLYIDPLNLIFNFFFIFKLIMFIFLCFVITFLSTFQCTFLLEDTFELLKCNLKCNYLRIGYDKFKYPTNTNEILLAYLWRYRNLSLKWKFFYWLINEINKTNGSFYFQMLVDQATWEVCNYS